ncbi:MAG: glycosyltransferase family 1 protein [Burkholderiales bacterium]|nr:glycosyltransferase family 1 protein [Burkholderiales bacterium]
MVTETYPPEVNGVARTAARMAEGLRARGHELQLVRPRQNGADVAANEPGLRELLRPGLPIPRYPQLRFGLPAGRALARAWRERRPDVVSVVTEGPLGRSAVSAARRLGIPVVTEFHTNFHAYSGHYGIGWMRRPILAYLRRFHRRAACTLVPTRELAAQLAAMGIERVRVVGRGVDHGTFSPARRSAELRRSWGASERTPVALCVSRFAPEKNFPLALEAWRAMRLVRPDTKLVLVGDGPMRAELERSGADCIVAGRKLNGELAAYYASADIFLFPSETETFGIVTLEAMASGLAVLAYDYAAAREHLQNGVSGLLAPPGDRHAFIIRAQLLARDVEFARRLGRAARHAAESLGWDRVVGDFEAALAQAASGAGGRDAA